MTLKSIFIRSSYIAKNVTPNFALIKNFLFLPAPLSVHGVKKILIAMLQCHVVA